MRNKSQYLARMDDFTYDRQIEYEMRLQETQRSAEIKQQDARTLRTTKTCIKQLVFMALIMLVTHYFADYFPKTTGETWSKEHFIFKDWGSYTLNPTRMEAIKTINHTGFEKSLEQLETLTQHHKKLCQTKLETTKTKTEDKFRSQFKVLLNEFGLNDNPRNYEESKQFCEQHGAHLPEIRNYHQKSAVRNLMLKFRTARNYFPAGIESKPGMKEALYYSDRKVATISRTDDKDNLLKMKGYFGTLCGSQTRTATEKTWEHYVSPYYPENGNIPFYYILYDNYNNEPALDLCPLDSPNDEYSYDTNPDYKDLGVTRTSHTICQFPNFNILEDNTRKIIFDDEAENNGTDNDDYTFFKDICSINNNILEMMTKEMKTLVDSINPTKARNRINSPVNYRKETNINKKRRHLNSLSPEDQSWKNQRRNSLSSGGSTSYDTLQSLTSESQSMSEKHKQTLVHRPHRAVGAVAAGIIGTIAISPLIALLNVAVVDSVYGKENEDQITNGEIRLNDFKMGDQSLKMRVNDLQIITEGNYESTNVGKLHRDLIHAESSIMHVYDSIYDDMKVSSNEFLALITQAKAGTATPAWLTPKELKKLKADFASQNSTMIETKYKKITMSLARRNDNYIIKYGLPVLEIEKKIRLFYIIPIPVFKNNHTHMAIIETPFVAISYTGRLYTPLTMEEANKCIETPKCQAESPTYEAKYAMCGASDFYAPSNRCLYNIQPGTRPFFKTIGRIVYYNLPREQSLFIHCFDEKLNIPGEEKEVKLKATTGNITLPLTCEARTTSTTIISAKNSENEGPPTTSPVEVLRHMNNNPAEMMSLMDAVDGLEAQISLAATYPVDYVSQKAKEYAMDRIFNAYGITFILVIFMTGFGILMRKHIVRLWKAVMSNRCKNNNDATNDSSENQDNDTSQLQPMRTTSDDDSHDLTSPGRSKTSSSLPMNIPRSSTFAKLENEFDYQRANSMEILTSPIQQTEQTPMQIRLLQARRREDLETLV
jgi:hypothetical protein